MFFKGKPQNGFTFVEVIVASVIVAILAAVAIPIYSGYITNQRMEVVKNMAQTAAMAENIFFRRTGGHADDLDDIKFFNPDPDRYDVVLAGGGVTVTDKTVSGVSFHVNF
jgi:type IV pilus assembly protein PilE